MLRTKLPQRYFIHYTINVVNFLKKFTHCPNMNRKMTKFLKYCTEVTKRSYDNQNTNSLLK